jgi:formylglycine-generating enzyme required for sulfatase activity
MAGSEADYWKRFEGCGIDGKYFLCDLIGVGGSAGVFSAEHVIGGRARRDVAVKLIERIRGSEQEQLEELVVSLVLSHPNILRCHDAGCTKLLQTELLYLVMERAEANLSGYTRHHTLTLDDQLAIFRQIAQGLHYLHNHSSHYVHRDIKPGNVLRVGDVWKLADFGIMQQLRGLTTVMTLQNPGTFPFMSPEANDGKITPAWDVWSLGVLMVNCLTGEYPFRQTQEKTLVQSIREDEPYFASPIPPHLEGVIQGCLTKDYRKRWTAEQVAQSLASVPTEGSASPIAAPPSKLVTSHITALSDQLPPITLMNSTELVHIPAGEFWMGSNERNDEKPPHRVWLKGYFIARTQVTVRAFKQFCAETGRPMPDAPDFNPNWRHEDHPMVNVSWFGAVDYCEWLSRISGYSIGLPTEAQWEKAARGADERRYPWGNAWDPHRLHCSKQKGGDAGGTCPVGYFPSGGSRYGVLDLAGNVWEWCADWYDATYYQECVGQGVVSDPGGPEEDHGVIMVLAQVLGGAKRRNYIARAVRGGSWFASNPDAFCGAYRSGVAPDELSPTVGFRCVAVSRDTP